MKIVMILTQEEATLIERHRLHIKTQALFKEQRKNCDHHWRFSCTCHNDDAYECTKCGEVEYR